MKGFVSLVLVFIIGLLAPALTAFPSPVTDHGVVADVAYPAFGGSVTAVNVQGDRLVVCPVWTGWNEEGVRGSAFLTVNLENGTATMTETVYGDTAFGSFLSETNQLYFAQSGELVAFDVNKQRVRKLGKHPRRFPIWFTSDSRGRIYIVCYPNAELLRYDPEKDELHNFGAMADESWPQYARVDMDASDWVYIAIRHKAANIVGFHPATGERREYLDADERVYVDKVAHYQATDGAVYIRLDSDGKWRRFLQGEMTFVDRPHPERAMYRNATRSPHVFPDGSRVSEVRIPERNLVLHEPDGVAREIPFDYEAEGARIYSLAGYNGDVFGSTGLPAITFRLNADGGAIPRTQVPAVLHMNVWTVQAGKLYGGAYSNGYLFEYDSATALEGGFKPVFTDDEARDFFGRPYELIAHPDGKTVIMTGNAARAREGGGMLLYDTASGEGRVLTPQQLIPGQAIKSLVALENGDLLGGTTTGAATGGIRVADEAEMFRLSWPDLEVTHRWKPLPGIAAVYDLLLCGNRVFGLSSNSDLFVIDSKTRETLHVEQLSGYGEPTGAPGRQTTNVMVAGTSGEIYLLFTGAIIRVDTETFAHEAIYKPERNLTGSLARVGDTLYFASGANLLSLPLR